MLFEYFERPARPKNPDAVALGKLGQRAYKHRTLKVMRVAWAKAAHELSLAKRRRAKELRLQEELREAAEE
jgi:hypothetical protein